MSDQSRFHGVTVVIVDDNETTRAMLRAIMRSEGIEVVAEAKEGATALQLIQKYQPNLVCLDVMMPNTGGIEALAQIKKEYPGCKVLMISGSTDRDTVRAAIEGGAVGYLIKPFNGAKVISAIEKALGMASKP